MVYDVALHQEEEEERRNEEGGGSVYMTGTLKGLNVLLCVEEGREGTTLVIHVKQGHDGHEQAEQQQQRHP